MMVSLPTFTLLPVLNNFQYLSMITLQKKYKYFAESKFEYQRVKPLEYLLDLDVSRSHT